jgi:hypothetical protein
MPKNMGGGKNKKYHSKQNKHYDVISLKKKKKKKHLINDTLHIFATNIYKILIDDQNFRPEYH